jgi:hypothetical protein
VMSRVLPARLAMGSAMGRFLSRIIVIELLAGEDRLSIIGR